MGQQTELFNDLNQRKKFEHTCGRCGHVWRTVAPRSKRAPNLCIKCVHLKRVGSYFHKSGTFIDHNVRDPNDPHHRSLIKCYNCKQESFAWWVTIDDPAWSGLCSECIKHRVDPKTYTHDEHLASGSIIHWGTSDGTPQRRVTITCGLCKKPWLITRGSLATVRVDSRGMLRGGWPGYCPSHYRHPAELFILLANLKKEGQEPEGNGEKKSRGRQAGDKIFDRSQFLADLKTAIRELAAQGKAARSITRDLVASNYRLGGEHISADAVTKRLRACGVDLDWPTFVESILREQVEIKSNI